MHSNATFSCATTGITGVTTNITKTEGINLELLETVKRDVGINKNILCETGRISTIEDIAYSIKLKLSGHAEGYV